MVGNDVAGELVFDDRFPANKKLYDSLLDNVSIVSVDSDTEVQQGYLWDGSAYVQQLTSPGVDNVG